MGYLKEQVSYLRGLADGMAMDNSKGETKLLDGILMLLNDMVDSIEANECELEDLGSEIDEIEESIDSIETFIFEDDLDFSPTAEDDDSGDFVELECPSCHERIFFDVSMLEDKEPLTCPNCESQIPISEAE